MPNIGRTRIGQRAWRARFLPLAMLAAPLLAAAKTRKGIFGEMESLINISGLMPGPDQEVETVLGILISTLLAFLGVLFMILIIYGGYLWMTARGAEDQVSKSKKIITSASIGLGVVLAAYLISFIVIQLVSIPTVKTP